MGHCGMCTQRFNLQEDLFYQPVLLIIKSLSALSALLVAFATNFSYLAPGRQNKHTVWVELSRDSDIDCFVSTLSGFYINCKYSCVSGDNTAAGGFSSDLLLHAAHCRQ